MSGREGVGWLFADQAHFAFLSQLALVLVFPLSERWGGPSLPSDALLYPLPSRIGFLLSALLGGNQGVLLLDCSLQQVWLMPHAPAEALAGTGLPLESPGWLDSVPGWGRGGFERSTRGCSPTDRGLLMPQIIMH